MNAAAIFLLVRDSCGRCWSLEIGHWLWSLSDSSQGIFTDTIPEEKCNLYYVSLMASNQADDGNRVS